ncbi:MULTISPECIES: DUF998 domain-containing protein [Isoptericola]|uniref:DUF998 domain-containing protein n=1 Tax=Isoptericola sediminis TaxID=2733572 RepID=A0A849JSE9_9MICO|nr:MULTISPECIES: DUF998 domain-containing protein [unclassified Isoptericola]MDO8144886.1 DUF998 domain-containing protein [Isoptericola sp. 178]MDO8152600.1 DUF998 domain-containing protein [Isoptericola sp. b408]NNU26232.1 DUF998 domain-containing protein [Isoptericola sediminis]
MSRSSAVTVLVLLGAALLCLALAPLAVPDSYDVVRHSVSESAGQGVPGAWVARTGFVLLGLAVLVEAARAGEAWGPWGRGAHAVYGAGMFGVAVFSHSPWYSAAWDRAEDTLHTVASTTVGFAFMVGVLAVTIRRGRRPGWIRVLDIVALVAAVVLPLTMLTMPFVAGAAQRLLFAIGLTWYGVEAVRLARPDAPGRYREL